MNVTPKPTPQKDTPLEEVFTKAGVVFCKVCRTGFILDHDIVSIKKNGKCIKCSKKK